MFFLMTHYFALEETAMDFTMLEEISNENIRKQSKQIKLSGGTLTIRSIQKYLNQ